LPVLGFSGSPTGNENHVPACFHWNLPNRFAVVAKLLTFPLGPTRSAPTDRQIDAVAEAMTTDMDVRDALTADIFIPGPDDPGLGRLDHAFARIRAAAPVRAKLEQARRDGRLAKDSVTAMTIAAVAEGIVSETERTLIERAERLRDEVIQVSEFDPVAYGALR
jgi:acyl-CoA dehydrogenase